MNEVLEPRIEAYIATQLPQARNIAVRQLVRIAGGASQETLRFVLSYVEEGVAFERRLILRRDLPSSMLESDRRLEFETYRAMYGSAIPVPQMLWFESGAEHLDRPFLIAQEIHGFEANPYLLLTEEYHGSRGKIGQHKWTIAGELAKIDPATLSCFPLFDRPDLDNIWRVQLDRWEKVLIADYLGPEPIVSATIRWMRRNPPPPPPKLSLVHGDFRSGNFLYDKEGVIHAVLDWEMAHLGDPLEDLAWSMNPVWKFARNELAGGLLPDDEAIAVWERASGMAVDRVALHWWELLASVKGKALWVSAAHNAMNGTAREVAHLLGPWSMMNGQDRAILKQLRHI